MSIVQNFIIVAYQKDLSAILHASLPLVVQTRDVCACTNLRRATVGGAQLLGLTAVVLTPSSLNGNLVSPEACLAGCFLSTWALAAFVSAAYPEEQCLLLVGAGASLTTTEAALLTSPSPVVSTHRLF